MQMLDETHKQLQQKESTSDSLLKEQLRDSSQCLTDKLKQLRNFEKTFYRRKQSKNINYKKSLVFAIKLKYTRFKQRLNLVIKRDLWGSHLKAIHNQFGPHTSYYFYLIKWFFYINLIGSILNLFFIVLPVIVYDLENDVPIFYHQEYKQNVTSNNTGTEKTFAEKLQDFFTTNSILYYGHYSSNAWINGMPYAYLVVFGIYILFNIIFAAYKLGSNYSKNFMQEIGLKRARNIFASKVFSSWDFSMTSSQSIQLQQNQFVFDIKVSDHQV